MHVYWLNTYWDFEKAIHGASKDTAKYFSDGENANIGVTVRCEIGASFGRFKYDRNFELIVGAPHDAQGLAWVNIQSRLLGVPIYWLFEKNEVFSNEWYDAILQKLST